MNELKELWARPWKGPIPPEDAEWAKGKREQYLRNWLPARRELAGKNAHLGYLESRGDELDSIPSTWEEVNKEAWFAFGDRIFAAPDEESELETLGPALEAYTNIAGQERPTNSDHWLAALRRVRKVFGRPKD